ncbi:MAG: hypothetical protein EBZ36_09990 [Acidobacteria bacterium]|nr:hypothetical protein [Acidobacteriota bacterium]
MLIPGIVNTRSAGTVLLHQVFTIDQSFLDFRVNSPSEYKPNYVRERLLTAPFRLALLTYD